MKFIHTGDWHIGKLVHQVHMTPDQHHVLKQFVQLVKEEKPHAVIIAGDLYDRSVPPVEAVELLDRIFSEIVLELGIPVLAIGGNHDSPDRLAFGSQLLRKRGLYIEGKLSKDIEPVRLADEFGPVNFYLIPFADPATVRMTLGNTEIQTFDQAMEAILHKIEQEMNPHERNVVVAHGLVVGGEVPETSESERPLSLGGAEYIEVRHFEPFHYTALGHLHSPQKVQWQRVRYAGSLMKYSFSEAQQKKSITLVELDQQGKVTLEERQLTPLRDMRKLQGELNQLLKPVVYEKTEVGDYLMITLTDAGELIDAIGKLRAVYPNLLRLERAALNYQPENQKISAGKDYAQKTKAQLFQEFYQKVTGLPFEEEKSQVLTLALEKAAVKGRE